MSYRRLLGGLTSMGVAASLLALSVAMRKSPLVARSRSPLVAR